MRASYLMTAVFAAAVWTTVPGEAAAATLSCPEPIGSWKHQYTSSGVTACVFGDDDNIGQGNPLNDDFLQGDALGGNPPGTDPLLGGGWGIAHDDISFTFDATCDPGFSDCGTWTITNFDPTLEYAVGISNGQDPKWAVFLVDNAADVFTGDWTIGPKGEWSHGALYVRGDTVIPVSGGQEPEPALLALLGGGLAVAARRLRRRTAA